ncbi:MAG: hypothetical protein L6R36_004914 [Xanthoria steineri]|nr:MAG: hypothetical protein L6R36_004914 [Xanthoria steineri]
MTHSKSRSVNGEPDPNILWIAVNRWTMKPRFIKTMRISTTGLQKAQYEHPGFMRDPRGNGKLLLSKERRPILDWPQLPKVLSSKVKAWAPGKYQSPLNPHIKLEDQFESNPKDDGDDEQPLPAEVEVIIKDERDQRHTRTILYPTTSYTRQPLCSGALTWEIKEGTRGIRDAIESVMPQLVFCNPMRTSSFWSPLAASWHRENFSSSILDDKMEPGSTTPSGRSTERVTSYRQKTGSLASSTTSSTVTWQQQIQHHLINSFYSSCLEFMEHSLTARLPLQKRIPEAKANGIELDENGVRSLYLAACLDFVELLGSGDNPKNAEEQAALHDAMLPTILQFLDVTGEWPVIGHWDAIYIIILHELDRQLREWNLWAMGFERISPINLPGPRWPDSRYHKPESVEEEAALHDAIAADDPAVSGHHWRNRPCNSIPGPKLTENPGKSAQEK